MVTQQVMTEIEALVAGWLRRRKIDFDFQTSLAGGLYSLGGAVLDFILTELNIGLRIQGEYWHRGVEKAGTDIIQKEQLLAMGFTAVVDLREVDIKERLEQTMRLAIEGKEVLQ